MTKKEVQERLHREPFEPFRVNTSDGKHFDVIAAQSAVAMDTQMFVAFPERGYALIWLRHVTSLEGLATA
jgi:hypothetical protein